MTVDCTVKRVAGGDLLMTTNQRCQATIASWNMSKKGLMVGAIES